MTYHRLPVKRGDDRVVFDPAVSSPLIQRGIELLTAMAGRSSTVAGDQSGAPVLIWTIKGYGRLPGFKPVTPDTLPLIAENVPAELTRLKRWVCWDWAWVAGGTKPPISPITGGGADEDHESTWATFDEARSYAERFGLPGIGFVLTADESIVGVDIDHCRDPLTGEIDRSAAEIVARLHSYTEVTPTGLGLHVLATGKLPEEHWYDPVGRPEMYDEHRYFAMTGHRLPGTPADVRERPTELAAVYAKSTEEARQDGIWGPDYDAAAWNARRTESGEISVYAYRDMVLVQRWDGCLYALDPDTGAIRWRSRAPLSIVAVTSRIVIGAPPSGPHGQGLQTPRQTDLFALDTTTGRELWRTPIPIASPTCRIADKMIYAYGKPGKQPNKAQSTDVVVAIDAGTGQERWRTSVPVTSMTYQVVDGAIYVRGLASPELGGADSRYHLLALDAHTGRESWRHADSGFGSPEPRPFNGLIFGVESEDKAGFIYAVKADSGEEIWRQQTPLGTQLYPGAVENGVAFTVFEENLGLTVLDAATGREVWHINAADWVFAPVPGDDVLFIAAGFPSDEIMCLEAATGNERWRTKLDVESHPIAAADGLVYVLSTDRTGPLIALDNETGIERWRIQGLEDSTWNYPSLLPFRVPDGVVGFPLAGGGIVAVEPKSGLERWRIKVDDRGGVRPLPPDPDGAATAMIGTFDDEWRHWLEIVDIEVQGDRLFLTTNHSLFALRLPE